ncbi:MAG: amidohydrolase family protein [Pirellulales bacterium]|nr:amidohydrolase family protein [Pirellulales bacterium]
MMASSAGDRLLAYRARWVIPVALPPLAGGCVAMRGARIEYVGISVPDGAELVDLGDVALLPGLVNPHTHLEFSDLACPLGRAGMSFTAWIALVTASRGNAEQPRPAPAESIALGLAESRAAGVTTVGDIATAGWQLSHADAAATDVTAFAEVITLSALRFAEALDRVRRNMDDAAAIGMWRGAICPHAPYTVHPELFAKLVNLGTERGVAVAFHLAESADELEMMRDNAGPLIDYLTSRGFWIPGSIPCGTRPLDYLRVLARAPRSLVIHGNLLDDEEIAFVAAQRERMSVVYCPRTHAYFDHPPHPLPKLLAAGARVALGTDGRVSNPDLNLLAEASYVDCEFQSIAPADVLAMITLRAAEALGLAAEVGSLEPGKRADLAVLALPTGRSESADPYEAILGSDCPVVRTMHAGAWV